MLAEWLTPIVEWSGLGLLGFLVFLCLVFLILSFVRG